MTHRGISVVLNVYDLHPYNKYSYALGLGAFHSGVVVLGREWAFGCHPYDFTGVYDVPPGTAEGAALRCSVDMGPCAPELGSEQRVRAAISAVASRFPGRSYHILQCNCNTFSDALCLELTGRHIPGWVNRAAWFATHVSCLLPPSFAPPVAPPVDPNANPDRPRVQSFSGQGVTLSGGAAAVVAHDESAESRRQRALAAALRRAGANEETIPLATMDGRL
eukprot:m51a1_g14177 hypothetical protein (221) ;mRNA; r:48432-49222